MKSRKVAAAGISILIARLNAYDSELTGKDSVLRLIATLKVALLKLGSANTSAGACISPSVRTYAALTVLDYSVGGAAWVKDKKGRYFLCMSPCDIAFMQQYRQVPCIVA